MTCPHERSRSPVDNSALLCVERKGSAGLVLVPYLDGERTPNRPNASGALHGLRVSNSMPANLARAAVEGMLCALAEGLAQLTTHGVSVRRILLIGGGAQSRAVCEIAPTVFGMPVLVPTPAEYVALGAARQAAWAGSGSPEPPGWSPPATREFIADSEPAVLQHYYEVRELTEGN